MRCRSAQPEFQEQTWQYINRRVSDWRVSNGKEIAQGTRAAARAHRARVSASTAISCSALWGVESAYGDPTMQEKLHAAGVPGAGGAGLGRAAPARLLGTGAAQRAGHRRARLEHARARCAAPGPAPWGTPNGCRRSGSTSASTSTATAASRRSAARPTRSPRTARYLVKRGDYRRGERWGYEVQRRLGRPARGKL